MQVKATELAPGMVLTDHPERVQILRECEEWKDRFGRTMFRFWAKRLDNGIEGYVLYGPDGIATIN